MATDNQHTRRRGARIELIGAACGVGAPDSRCSAGPDALREGGIVTTLCTRAAPTSWRATLRPDPALLDDPSRTVSDLCDRLARRTRTAVLQGRMPVVLGGDHSCAIGTWKGVTQGLQARGPLGLIWIDAHMDAHTPQTTPSGMLHGMPLACLLGHGISELVDIADRALLAPQHVCLIGVRSFETGEAALLQHLGVRVFSMPEVARRGLDAVMGDALTIAAAGTAGVGVTLDLDALDPHDAPGVGTPVASGLRAQELLPAMARIGGSGVLAGAEIVEYNPHRDRNGRTARLASELLTALLQPVRVIQASPDRTYHAPRRFRRDQPRAAVSEIRKRRLVRQ